MLGPPPLQAPLTVSSVLLLLILLARMPRPNPKLLSHLSGALGTRTFPWGLLIP